MEKENNLLKLKLAGLQKEVAENSEQTTLLSEGNTNLKLVLKELQGEGGKPFTISFLLNSQITSEYDSQIFMLPLYNKTNATLFWAMHSSKNLALPLS